MIVRYDSSLKRGAQHLVDRLSHAFEERMSRGLVIPDLAVNLTWTEYRSDGITIPVITRLPENQNRNTLIYFITHVRETGLAQTDSDIGTILTGTDDLGAVVHAARQAYANLDMPSALGTVDIPRTIEHHMHEDSLVTRELTQQKSDYWQGRFHMKPSMSESYAVHALDMAEEDLRNDINRILRTEIVASALGHGSKAPTALESDARYFALHETITLLNLPAQIEGRTVSIADERLCAPLIEAKDRIEAVERSAIKGAKERIINAVAYHPERFAIADEHARTPDE